MVFGLPGSFDAGRDCAWMCSFVCRCCKAAGSLDAYENTLNHRRVMLQPCSSKPELGAAIARLCAATWPPQSSHGEKGACLVPLLGSGVVRSLWIWVVGRTANSHNPTNGTPNECKMQDNNSTLVCEYGFWMTTTLLSFLAA